MPKWFQQRKLDCPYFCVTGSPVAHSKSPLIHAAFAAQFARKLVYDRIEVGRGHLAEAVAEFRAIGGSGMNVTIPLKEEAFALAGEARPRAAAAGVANTLWFDPRGRVVADNTDGTGLVRDLEWNHGVPLAGRRLLLLGAGGAARGVLPALCAAHPATIVVSNRTRARAESLAAGAAPGTAVQVVDWGDGPGSPVDVVINATAMSLSGLPPPLPAGVVGTETICYDLMYGAAAAVFLGWARGCRAARALDGLGMLVEQAAEAFYLWHGLQPETAPVIALLRAAG